MRTLHAAVVAGVATLAIPQAAAAAPPAPCNGVAQISDVALDGHHPNTDVLGAWFSEANGRLQAVIRPRVADWAPAHDESAAAGWAMLFTQAGRTRFVRVVGPRGPALFDFGTWTAPGGFASAGATAGVTETGGVTIDVPGAAPGAVLAQPFVLTYDGGTPPNEHWVDRAPGGTTPAGADFGADYVAGSCSGGGAPPPGGGGGPAPVTGVTLNAPARVTGAKTVTVRGSVTPARAGVAVVLSKRTRGTSTRTLTTAADGGFSARVRISETARLSASAGGLSSQTERVVVKARVRIKVRRMRDGDIRVTGTVEPRLPGRLLLLHRNAVSPRAAKRPSKGRFAFRFERLRKGRWQVVFVPSRGRALRATSNTGVVR